MIKSIELENFKCFEKAKIPLKKLNVLAGLNGMGKSTVIQSLVLIKQSYLERHGEAGLLLNGDYVKLGNSQDVLYEKATSDEIVIKIEEEKDENVYRFRYEPNVEKLLLADESYIFEKATECTDVQFYSAYRIEPKPSYDLIDDKQLRFRQFDIKGEAAVQYLATYGKESLPNEIISSSKLDEQNDSIMQQVQAWMRKIAPGIIVRPNVDNQERSSKLGYVFKEGEYATNTYKSSNVGFGITYVLPIITALVSACSNDIILIENPEAHLHPAGQRALGELIGRTCSCGAQVIVETHSDHLINGIRLAVKNNIIDCNNVNILFFYKDENDDFRHKFTNPVVYNNGKLSEWPEGFMDEWDKALMEII